MQADDVQMISSRNLVERANRSEISSISVIIAKILGIIKDPNASATQLRDIIEVDPPLCAKVLRRANSAFYGIKRNIASIQQAIVFLGFSTIKELAISLTVGNLFSKDHEIGSYSRKALWKHSVAVSLCCKYLYRREFMMPGDEVYSAGLIHDIGIIVEDQFLQNHFVTMIEKTLRPEQPLSILRAERETFGYTHEQVGGELINAWQLPKEISGTVACHHRPLFADPLCSQAARVMFVADHMCNMNELGVEKSDPDDGKLFETCVDSIKVGAKSVEIIFSDVREEINRLEESGDLFV